MSNIVWDAEYGWHDGPEIDNAELVKRFRLTCERCGEPLRHCDCYDDEAPTR